MMQKGEPLGWPTFARRAPIFAAGSMVGTAEVSASLRPLLTEVALVGSAPWCWRSPPISRSPCCRCGVLDRTLAELGPRTRSWSAKTLQQREEELEAQNTRFNAAIDNMSQGMCLFDAEQRVVFANGAMRRSTADPRAGEAGHDAAPDLRGAGRQRRLRTSTPSRVRRRGRRQLQQGKSRDRPAGRRALHLGRCAGRWRTAASSARTRTSPSARSSMRGWREQNESCCESARRSSSAATSSSTPP